MSSMSTRGSDRLSDAWHSDDYSRDNMVEAIAHLVRPPDQSASRITEDEKKVAEKLFEACD